MRTRCATGLRHSPFRRKEYRPGSPAPPPGARRPERGGGTVLSRWPPGAAGTRRCRRTRCRRRPDRPRRSAASRPEPACGPRRPGPGPAGAPGPAARSGAAGPRWATVSGTGGVGSGRTLGRLRGGAAPPRAAARARPAGGQPLAAGRLAQHQHVADDGDVEEHLRRPTARGCRPRAPTSASTARATSPPRVRRRRACTSTFSSPLVRSRSRSTETRSVSAWTTGSTGPPPLQRPARVGQFRPASLRRRRGSPPSAPARRTRARPERPTARPIPFPTPPVT